MRVVSTWTQRVHADIGMCSCRRKLYSCRPKGSAWTQACVCTNLTCSRGPAPSYPPTLPSLACSLACSLPRILRHVRAAGCVRTDLSVSPRGRADASIWTRLLLPPAPLVRSLPPSLASARTCVDAVRTLEK
jgi:hypothetical protein